MECKICKQVQPKIKSEKVIRSGLSNGFTYRDCNGKRWSGLICPTCIKKIPPVKLSKEKAKLQWTKQNNSNLGKEYQKKYRITNLAYSRFRAVKSDNYAKYPPAVANIIMIQYLDINF